MLENSKKCSVVFFGFLVAEIFKKTKQVEIFHLKYVMLHLKYVMLTSLCVSKATETCRGFGLVCGHES